jgi:hypothetical protein
VLHTADAISKEEESSVCNDSLLCIEQSLYFAVFDIFGGVSRSFADLLPGLVGSILKLLISG